MPTHSGQGPVQSHATRSSRGAATPLRLTDHRRCSALDSLAWQNSDVHLQRYVSPDLTHFVGQKCKTHKDRYRLLKKILREGRLRAPKPARVRDATYVLLTDTTAKLSSNNAYRGSVVCFCDIPPGDLAIHMEKYGEFGLAFTKDFLMDFGATPIMYVPTTARPALLPYNNYPRGRVSSNTVAFDQFWKKYQRLATLARQPDAKTPPFGKTGITDLRDVLSFLEANILSHLKFFDPATAEWDHDNYYMEREWRVNQDVLFELDTVRRVIIPPAYARQFRKDFPRYDKLLFTD